MAAPTGAPVGLQQAAIHALLQNGIAVFKLDNDAMHTWVKPLLTTLPELKDPVAAYSRLHEAVLPNSGSNVGVPTPQFVLGAFGAAGLPSLFHHPIIREIRKSAYDTMRPQFAEAYNGWNLEVLFDRFGIRRNGLEVTGESWHRDTAPANLIEPGDVVFGGWVNLDPPLDAHGKATVSQGFTCVLNSLEYGMELPAPLASAAVTGGQMPRALPVAGFVPFTPDQQAALESRKTNIEVPPGSIVVFNQRIAHCITPNKARFTSFRLYTGWRITKSVSAMYNDTQAIIDEQGVPRLPSGQKAPMYSPNHISYDKAREGLLKPFSATFIPALLQTEHPTEKQLTIGCIVRYCPSLQTLRTLSKGRCKMFDAYSATERAMFSPVLLGRRPALLKSAPYADDGWAVAERSKKGTMVRSDDEREGMAGRTGSRKPFHGIKERVLPDQQALMASAAVPLQEDRAGGAKTPEPSRDEDEDLELYKDEIRVVSSGHECAVDSLKNFRNYLKQRCDSMQMNAAEKAAYLYIYIFLS